MEHLPPWLRNVPLPRRPAGPGDAPPSADDVPDWLRDLQREVDSAAPEPPPGRSASSGATAWLNSLGAGQPVSEEPPAREPPAPEEPPTTNSRIKMPVGVTDWLRSIGQDPDARSEPLSEPISTPEEPDDGVPDWLRDLSVDEVERAVAAEPAPESQPLVDPQVPGWLADDGPGADASTVSANWPAGVPRNDTASAAEVPDWLRDVIAADSGEQSAPPRDPASVPQWLADSEPAPNLTAGAEVPAWLRDVEDSQAAPPGSTPGMVDEEVPAWLRGAEPERPEVGDEEVPGWLRGAEPERPEAGEGEVPGWLRGAEPERPGTGEGEVPGWLRGAEPERPETGDEEVPAWLRGAEPERPETGEGEVPAWLRGAEPERPGTGDEEVPAWLRGAEVPPSAEAAAPSQEAPAVVRPGDEEAEEIPDWLREAESGTAGFASGTGSPGWHQAGREPPLTSEEADDVPAWLREPDPSEREAGGGQPGVTDLWGTSEIPASDEAAPAWLRDETPASPAPGAPSRPAGNLPPWLQGDDPASGGPASGGDPGLPAWLRGVSDEPSAPPPRPEPATPIRRPAPVAPVAEEGDSHSFLKGAELPPWLRVPEPELPRDSAEGQQLEWLRRLGSPDQDDEAELPVQAAAIARPLRPGYERTAEQVAAVGLLQSLARSPYPAPVAVPAPRAPGLLQRIGIDRLLYALFVLALILGLLFPQFTAPFGTEAPSAPGAAELGALLDSLDADDVALVAYEWAAQRSAELRPLEQAITARLVANRTRLILVSTDLQGTLLSFDLIEPLRAAGYNNENGVPFGGRDYVLLGYRPGGELALRSLAQDLRGELRSDFDGQDASQGLVANNADGSPRISGVRDLALIVVLADQPQDVQVWMEQVHRVAPEVPIAFLLPQEAEPLAQPYLRLPNVYHVAGQHGALALSASAAGADGAAIGRATGLLWYAVVVFLGLLVVGLLLNLAARPSRRGSESGGGAA